MSKKVWLSATLALVLLVAVAGAVFAQTATPQAPNAAPTMPGLGKGFGLRMPFGGLMLGAAGKKDWTEFDRIADALKLTPTQLFDQLHSGKSLSDIATAQGVDLNTLQQAAQNARTQEMKDAIAQAVKDGRLSQDQADWLLKGLENGWMGGHGFGRFGRDRFGGKGLMGPGMRGGMRGWQKQQPSAQPTPNA